MKWLRHRKARQDRESGMAFAWRGMRGRLGSTLGSVVIVGLAASVFASVVRVRVLSPPARSERRGSLMISLDAEGSEWLGQRGAELTPFPAPLDVRRLDLSARALAGHPALAAGSVGPYQPKLRPLPEPAEPDRLPVASTDRQVLPPLPPLPEPAAARPLAERTWRPVLNPDSPELAARVPVPLPGLVLGGEGTAPIGAMRFLVEIGADGLVRSAVRLDPASADALPAVERWLLRVRFEPVEGGAGWFAVSVNLLAQDD